MVLARNNPGIGLAGALALSAALHIALIYGIAGGQRNVAESTGKAEKKSVIEVSILENSAISPLSLALMEPLTNRLGWQTTPAKSLVISPQAGRGGSAGYLAGERTSVPAPAPSRTPDGTSQSLPLQAVRGDHAYPSVSAGGKNTAEVMVAATTSDSSAATAPVTAVTTFAKALTPVRPDYPATAREGNITGQVTAKLLINETGVVVDSSVVNAEPAGHFEASALAALRSTRFSPATRNGVAVKSEQQMVVTYRLE